MTRMLLRYLSALSLLFIFGLQALAVERCQLASARNKRLGGEITDSRVVSATAAVIEASGFKSTVVLCELHMPYFNATIDHVGHFYAIGLTNRLIERTTDAELRAIIGHEIAHVVLGHRTPIVELTPHRTAKYEKAADELAARWFGNEPMLSVLSMLRDDAGRLESARLREQAIGELEVRIKALHAQRSTDELLSIAGTSRFQAIASIEASIREISS